MLVVTCDCSTLVELTERLEEGLLDPCQDSST